MHQCVDIKRYCQTVDGIFPDGKNGRRKPWFWSERALTMLTDVSLKNLKSKSKVYKVADRDGMYVAVAPSGQITFRYDYRLNGRRGTLTIGRYGRDGISLASPRRGSGAGRQGSWLQQRRFSAAGWAQQHNDFSSPNLEVDALQREHLYLTRRVGLGQGFRGEDGVGHGYRGNCRLIEVWGERSGFRR